MTKILEILGLCIIMMISLSFITGCEDAEDVIHSDSSNNIKIDWCYGGVNGSGSVEDPNCQIENLKISANGMSYRWKDGKTMKAWNEVSPSECTGLACIFYYDENSKSWKGGKFDHISSSRTTRDFKNLHGYNGWNYDAFMAAKKHAFCILSYNNKKRTNIIFDN